MFFKTTVSIQALCHAALPTAPHQPQLYLLKPITVLRGESARIPHTQPVSSLSHYLVQTHARFQSVRSVLYALKVCIIPSCFVLVAFCSFHLYFQVAHLLRAVPLALVHQIPLLALAMFVLTLCTVWAPSCLDSGFARAAGNRQAASRFPPWLEHLPQPLSPPPLSDLLPPC